MKRQIRFIIPLLLVLSLVACATDTPWRKAAVTSYELVGIGIGAGKDTAESLRAQNLITEEQVVKIKVAYNKARDVYIAAGNTLKLAGRAVDVSKRDALLVEYDKLLTDFRALAYQLYDLLKGFKKVSYLNVMHTIAIGGEMI